MVRFIRLLLNEKGRFLWSAHRITERQKAGKARSIKGKQLKNSRSTVSRLLVELHSSQRDNQKLGILYFRILFINFVEFILVLLKLSASAESFLRFKFYNKKASEPKLKQVRRFALSKNNFI